MWPVLKGKEQFAILTMVKNDFFSLECWINHYMESLNPNIYIIDHSSDLSVKEWCESNYPNITINVLNIPNVQFDDRFKSAALSSLANILQACFDVVITSDVDEIVVPINRKNKLCDLLLASNGDFIAPIGMEPVHRTESENDFCTEIGVLLQRNIIFLTSGYTKPVIWKSQANFTPGLHGLDKNYSISTELALVHLRSVDIEQCRKKQENRNNTSFSNEQEIMFGTSPWKKNIDDKTWYGNWIFNKANSVLLDGSVNCTVDTLVSFADDIEIKLYGDNYKHNISVVTGLMSVGFNKE